MHTEAAVEEHGITAVVFDNISFVQWQQPWRSKCSCEWLSGPSRTVSEAGEKFDRHLSERDGDYDTFKGYSDETL